MGFLIFAAIIIIIILIAIIVAKKDRRICVLCTREQSYSKRLHHENK